MFRQHVIFGACDGFPLFFLGNEQIFLSTEIQAHGRASHRETALGIPAEELGRT
jgi:hypothetical protein